LSASCPEIRVRGLSVSTSEHQLECAVFLPQQFVLSMRAPDRRRQPTSPAVGTTSALSGNTVFASTLSSTRK
jgi:hypothetical protein